MKSFALIGASGYVAPKHMKAIKDTDNILVAALDNNDSIGIIDSYYPNAAFFVEFERFDRHIDKLRRLGDKIDYISICSPNYLHDSHIRFALRSGCHAICEKPLVLNPWNLEALKDFEEEMDKKVNCILQLRLHPQIIEFKEKIFREKDKRKSKYDIDLTYITARGKWYLISWKGDIAKSGGLATNIGIHFFDALTWIFGEVKENILHLSTPTRAAGILELENARIRWYLSTKYEDLPEEVQSAGIRTYRSISVDGKEIEVSKGFTDLHTLSYKEILKNNGYSVDETMTSLDIVYNIRNSNPIGLKGEYHPFCKKVING